jgi:hypothetical protein
MQRALNQIHMQDHSDEEEDNAAAIVPVEQQTEVPAPAPENMQLRPQDIANVMNISAAAYNGCPSESTISLLLHMGNSTAVALADTGSTNTFMDLAYANKHKIEMTPASQRTVKVAGGGLLSSGAIAYNCPFTVEGKHFTADFRILELHGSDIILGVNWFKRHNPVTFDFIGRSLTLGFDGKLHTFSDHLFPRDKFLISSDQCSKLIAEGATGFILFNSTEIEVANEDEQHPPI